MGQQFFDSHVYYDKLDEIVYSDKFVEVFVGSNYSKHPVITTERNIQCYLNKNLKSCLSDESYRSIYPSGCSPGAIYSTVKVHKNGNPLRPIISMVNTPQYELAKFLDKLIKPCIPETFALSSTADFLTKLHDMNPTDKFVKPKYQQRNLTLNQFQMAHDLMHATVDNRLQGR